MASYGSGKVTPISVRWDQEARQKRTKRGRQGRRKARQVNKLALVGEAALQRVTHVVLGAALVVAASGFGVLWSTASLADGMAHLEVVDSDVHLQRQGQTAFAALGSATRVATGSIVRTDEGGLAEIHYEDGSLTRVGPATTYRLTTLEIGEGRRQIVGQMDVGQTFHRVTKVTGSGSRFEVKTSNAVAAVRGTAFAVECRVLDVCDVSVTEGRVSVSSFGKGAVDVTAGQKVTVNGEGAVGEPQPISPSDLWVALNSGTSPGSADSPPASSRVPADASNDPPSTEPARSEPAPTEPAIDNSRSERSTGAPADRAPAGVVPVPDMPSSVSSPGTPESPAGVEPPVESGRPVECPASPAEERRSDAADVVRDECSSCAQNEASHRNPNCAGSGPEPTNPPVRPRD